MKNEHAVPAQRKQRRKGDIKRYIYIGIAAVKAGEKCWDEVQRHVLGD